MRVNEVTMLYLIKWTCCSEPDMYVSEFFIVLASGFML